MIQKSYSYFHPISRGTLSSKHQKDEGLLPILRAPLLTAFWNNYQQLLNYLKKLVKDFLFIYFFHLRLSSFC